MKSLLLIIFIIAFAFNAKCQSISNFGLKLGAGFSNQSWTNSNEADMGWKYKKGISPRIFAVFFIYPYFQIEGEAGYLRKGFEEERIPITNAEHPDGTGEYITANNALDYLTVSALAKFIHEAEIFSPYIILGPQLNLLVNKNVDKVWVEFFDNFNNYNVGLSVGAGFELKKILPVTILIEYRYEKDLFDNYSPAAWNIKNYSHLVLLGIKI